MEKVGVCILMNVVIFLLKLSSVNRQVGYQNEFVSCTLYKRSKTKKNPQKYSHPASLHWRMCIAMPRPNKVYKWPTVKEDDSTLLVYLVLVYGLTRLTLLVRDRTLSDSIATLKRSNDSFTEVSAIQLVCWVRVQVF